MDFFGLASTNLAPLIGGAGVVFGGYFKLKADIGKGKLDAQANLTAAEQAFRQTLIEQEGRCRADNDELRAEMIELRATSRAAEVIASVAKTQLQIVEALDGLRAAMGKSPAAN